MIGYSRGEPLKKPKIFYGYWIVVAAFFCVFVWSGCGFYAFSLFVTPLQIDLGWSRGSIMAAFTIYFLVMGMTSSFAGRLIDLYGARKIISIGSLIAGLGFVLLSLIQNIFAFYAGYVITGFGMAAIGQVPATTLVSNWFKKRRGTAIGIATTGVGAGGFAMATLVGGYLIPNFGWRTSYIVLALIIWILIPLTLLVIKTRPADLGLYPDGIKVPSTMTGDKVSPTVPDRLGLKIALGTSSFWLIAITFLTSNFSHVGIIQNQVPYLEDIGFTVTTASTVLGIIGLGSLIGKFGFGWLCDRIQAKYACSIGLGLQLAAIIILMSVRLTSPLVILWLYAIVMGLGVGSWLPTMSMLVSTNFGLASYGVIFGTIAAFQSVGIATGPLVAAHMYDTTNTYYWAFIIFLALYAISIPAVLAVHRPKSFW